MPSRQGPGFIQRAWGGPNTPWQRRRPDRSWVAADSSGAAAP